MREILVNNIRANLGNNRAEAIPLGRQGENKATKVIFDVEAWDDVLAEISPAPTDITYSLVAQLPGDAGEYVAVVTYSSADNEVTWVINSADVAKSGEGKCELRLGYKDSNNNIIIVKSQSYKTLISRALGDTTTPPAPWQAWVDKVLDATMKARAVANIAVESTTTLPAGSPATASCRIDQTDPDNPILYLSYGIPKGEDGEAGAYWATYGDTSYDDISGALEDGQMVFVNKNNAIYELVNSSSASHIFSRSYQGSLDKLVCKSDDTWETGSRTALLCPTSLPVANDFVAFNHLGVAIDSGKKATDFAAASHTHDDRYYTEAETDTLLNGKVNKVAGKGLSTNDYDATEKGNVASNTSARHTHSNKGLLDTYNQTNSNLADAVSKKHSHSNLAVLNGISASDISNWNGKQAHLTAGANITITPSNVISATAGVSIQVVEELPENPQSNVIYLVPVETPTQDNYYDEYIWVNQPFRLELAEGSDEFTTFTVEDADTLDDYVNYLDTAGYERQLYAHVEEVEEGRFDVLVFNSGDEILDGTEAGISWSPATFDYEVIGQQIMDIKGGQGWEHIGTTQVDLTNYYTKTETDSAISSHHDSTKADTSTTYTKTEVDGLVNAKADKGAYDDYSIASWTDSSSYSPFVAIATKTATTTIGADTLVELINNDAVGFATYGYAIIGVSGQTITFGCLVKPTSSVTLKVKIGGE